MSLELCVNTGEASDLHELMGQTDDRNISSCIFHGGWAGLRCCGMRLNPKGCSSLALSSGQCGQQAPEVQTEVGNSSFGQTSCLNFDFE